MAVEWKRILTEDDLSSSLPDQTGHSGEFLTTDGSNPSWAEVSGVTDNVARDNIVLLAWKLAIAEGLSIFKLEDGVVDEFEDETGVDTAASTNESYNSTDDYYSPAAGVVVDNMEYATDAAAQAAYVTNGKDLATGGTITHVGDKTIHTFTSDGTFALATNVTADVLVVAGGGGGAGTSDAGVGGGGGAGGVCAGSVSLSAGNITVTVGAGGAGGAAGGYNNGVNGSDSVLGTITANGGGGGGKFQTQGLTGGCGGGTGAYNNTAGGVENQGDSGGATGYGYNGGKGTANLSGEYGGGGGGGAGELGGDSGVEVAGKGGDGRASSISGSSVTYAGGGGGGGSASVPTGGTAGSGGGGAGGNNGVDGSNGTANTGGGGGGGGQTHKGGNGGSGIVIISYTTSLQSYSESTIKTQGSYSLKGVATTDAFNKTLTRTIGSPIDLTGVDSVFLDMYALRTGSNIKIGLHDSGGTTTEITPNITDSNTWQEVEIDLSGVADANKDAIDSIIVTIANADSANTFYLDSFSGLLENMTLISESAEAETEPTTGRFLALVEPVDSITVNTDLKGYISNDDGSNFDEVTLTDEGYFDSTKKILSGNVALTDRSDKTMVQKIQTLNNKDLKVHAWGMLWK